MSVETVRIKIPYTPRNWATPMARQHGAVALLGAAPEGREDHDHGQPHDSCGHERRVGSAAPEASRALAHRRADQRVAPGSVLRACPADLQAGRSHGLGNDQTLLPERPHGDVQRAEAAGDLLEWLPLSALWRRLPRQPAWNWVQRDCLRRVQPAPTEHFRGGHLEGAGRPSRLRYLPGHHQGAEPALEDVSRWQGRSVVVHLLRPRVFLDT